LTGEGKQKVRKMNLLTGVDFIFMNVFPKREIHTTIPLAINHAIDSLDEDWCCENTRFTVDQL
jgi:hypothetical protein